MTCHLCLFICKFAAFCLTEPHYDASQYLRAQVSQNISFQLRKLLSMATAAYFPSAQQASYFWETHSNKANSAPQVPDGFPEQLHSPLAWTRAEIESQRSKWTVELDEDDIEAVEAALASFEGMATRFISASFCIPADMFKLGPPIYHKSRSRHLFYQRSLLSV